MPRAHFQLILSKIRAKKPYLGITLQIMVIKSSKNVVKMGKFYYRGFSGNPSQSDHHILFSIVFFPYFFGK